MNRHRHRWLARFLVLVVVIPGVLPACIGQKTKLKIVTSFPMQGIASGKSVVNAVELALEEVGWQVAGYQIELVKLNNANENGQWDADLEKANVEKAVADSSVIAYIGPLNSDAAKISIPVASEAGLLQISPGATWPGLTKIGFIPGEPARFYPTGQRTFYRTCPTDDAQALAAAQWAKSLGFQRVYIIDDGETYGEGLSNLFEQHARSAGLKVIGHETIDKTTSSFAVTMSQLWHWKPDLVYFSGYIANGAIPLLKQMRTIKPEITANFMGTTRIVDTAFLQDADIQAEGAYATLVGVLPNQLVGRGQEFFKAYQEKYGHSPEALAASGYDAALVVLQALNAARTKDRQGVLEALAQPQTFEGANGKFGFDQNGDTTLVVISGNQVRNGQFEFIQSLDTE